MVKVDCNCWLLIFSTVVQVHYGLDEGVFEWIMVWLCNAYWNCGLEGWSPSYYLL